MNDDWTERLRKHLENYEVDPPPELWESICERLGIDPVPAPEPVPAKKPAQIKRWIWAAAAGILALVGVFVAYQGGDEETVAEKRLSLRLKRSQTQSQRSLCCRRSKRNQSSRKSLLISCWLFRLRSRIRGTVP